MTGQMWKVWKPRGRLQSLPPLIAGWQVRSGMEKKL